MIYKNFLNRRIGNVDSFDKIICVKNFRKNNELYIANGDLGVAVKKRNKSCYVLDGKVFSASIPINCEDISKLDCILYSIVI